jgi:hypothetical protein
MARASAPVSSLTEGCQRISIPARLSSANQPDAPCSSAAIVQPPQLPA